MERYIVHLKSQEGGEHEVHKASCPQAPMEKNQADLGEHETCRSALEMASKLYPDVDGCAVCSPDCHRR